MQSPGPLLLLLFALAVSWTGPAWAQETDNETIQRDVLVLMRALAYDRKLTERFGTELKVGVLHEGKAPADEAAMVVAILNALRDVRIGGLTVLVHPVAWTEPAALSTAMEEENLDVLYVPVGLDEAAKALPELTRPASRTSMTRHRPYAEAGLALAVDQLDGKPRIVVNLEAAKAEGAAFQADLLRLADVLR